MYFIMIMGSIPKQGYRTLLVLQPQQQQFGLRLVFKVGCPRAEIVDDDILHIGRTMDSCSFYKGNLFKTFQVDWFPSWRIGCVADWTNTVIAHFDGNRPSQKALDGSRRRILCLTSSTVFHYLLDQLCFCSLKSVYIDMLSVGLIKSKVF